MFFQVIWAGKTWKFFMKDLSPLLKDAVVNLFWGVCFPSAYAATSLSPPVFNSSNILSVCLAQFTSIRSDWNRWVNYLETPRFFFHFTLNWTSRKGLLLLLMKFSRFILHSRNFFTNTSKRLCLKLFPPSHSMEIFFTLQSGCTKTQWKNH